MPFTYIISILCVLALHTAVSYDITDDDEHDTFDETPLNFTIGPLNFSDTWIRRGRRKENVQPIWYRMTGREGPADIYVRAVYNTTSRTVHAFGVPCGKIPSITCMLEMLTDVVNSEPPDTRCKIKIPVPILYNIPRWTIEIAIPEVQLLQTDSFALGSIIVSTLIMHYMRGLNRTCARSIIPLYAIHRSVFNITTTWPAFRQFLIRIPKFRVLTEDTNETTISESATKNMFDYISISKFYDIVAFFFSALYSSAECRFRDDYNRETIKSKGEITTHAGSLKVPRLYVNDKTPPSFTNNKPINITSIDNMDGMLLDYLDSLALEKEIGKIKDHVPNNPHKRRTGLVSFRSV